MHGSRSIMNCYFPLLLFLVMFCFMDSYHVLSNMDIVEDDIALERQLEALNKPPRKTFQIKEGDTIDCIDIDKQRALDHPLLKNHKIQKKPSSSLASLSIPQESKLGAKPLQFEDREPCPDGTVPIKRITKEDLIRIRSIPHKHFPVSTAQKRSTNNGGSQGHLAAVYTTNVNVTKYGVGGAVTAYNLSVAPDQDSAAYIWVRTGPPNRFSMVMAGWMVNPGLYGDTATRLFTFWTGNAYHSGCFDMLCSGFVQVDHTINPSMPLHPISVYGGPQYELRFAISQDRETGNWWLLFYSPFRNISVGYWPNKLLPYLRKGSLHAQWGGLVHESYNGNSPPMGDGHYPVGDFKYESYFENIYYIDQNGIQVPNSHNTANQLDSSKCYGLWNYYHHPQTMGYTFSFGGPGGTDHKCDN